MRITNNVIAFLKVFIFIISGNLSITSYSQDNSILTSPDITYSHKQYTLHEGLVQMQVTALFQDEKGFLWCGTKGGISRFDGKSFVNYSKAEARLSGMVIKFGKDSHGNLLIFHTYGITKFNGSDFTSYPFKEGWHIVDYNSNFLEGNYLLLENKSDKNKFYSKLCEFRDTSLITIYNPLLNTNSQGFLVHSDLNNENHFWILTRDSIRNLNIKDNTTNFKIKAPNIKAIFSLNDTIYGLKRNGIYKWTGKDFQLVDKFLFNDNFPKPVFSPDKKTIIIKTLNTLYEFNGKSLQPVMEQLNYIRDILFDYENNLWVATEEGLINIFQLDFINYSFIKDASDYVWTIMEDGDNVMWFASFTNGLWNWDGNQITDFTNSVHNTLHVKPMFYMGSSKFKNNLYFPNIQNVVKYDGDKFSLIRGTLGACLFSRTLKDGTLLIVSHKGLYEIKQGNVNKFWPDDSLSISRLTTVNINKEGYYVAGGYDGLSIIRENEITNINNKATQSILCIEKDHYQNLWVGGINENLSLLVGDELILVHQFQNNAIHSLLFVDPNWLLIGCRNGLYIMDLEKYYLNTEVHLLEYNHNNGFIGLECGQNAFFKDSKGDVWIATSDLVTRFDPKKLIREAAIPKIYIDPPEISNNKIDWNAFPKNEIKSIQYNYNSIKFKFTSVCFSAIDNIHYYYKLSGIQEEWSAPQKNNEIIFYNLSPGEYTLQLKADNGTSSVITPVITSSFTIKPALWQQVWFIVITGTLIIFLFYLSLRHYYTTRIKKQEKELALERMRTGLQVKALDNKSNHHFIFNILNNIGFNIIKKDTNEAYTLFSRLAGYFRLSLKSPDSFTTPLNHQIETVSDYLYLQKNRLGKRLNYSIENNNQDLNNIELPRNILQTITDNAVSHGIEPKEGGGNVDIEIQTNNNLLIISIKDDGIGRQKAQNTNPDKRHGLGLNIYRDFFNLFNKNNDHKAELIITDLTDQNNNACGTLVEIIIPVDYSFRI